MHAIHGSSGHLYGVLHRLIWPPIWCAAPTHPATYIIWPPYGVLHRLIQPPVWCAAPTHSATLWCAAPTHPATYMVCCTDSSGHLMVCCTDSSGHLMVSTHPATNYSVTHSSSSCTLNHITPSFQNLQLDTQLLQTL